MLVFDQYLAKNKLFPEIADVLTGMLLKIRALTDIVLSGDEGLPAQHRLPAVHE